MGLLSGCPLRDQVGLVIWLVGLVGFAEGDEFGVAEDAAGGDFGEFDFGFDFGTQPVVVGHFVGSHAFAAEEVEG